MNGYRLVEAIWMLFFIAFFGSLVYALIGCTPTPCVKPVVSLAPPVLPTIPADNLSCLTDETYLRLVERDLALQSALRECRVIVDELTD